MDRIGAGGAMAARAQAVVGDESVVVVDWWGACTYAANEEPVE